MMNKDYAAKAEELFRQGYNCSQAVIGAFAEELGMDFETAVKMATPFGGGLGRLRHVCGAVSGMAMVCGMLNGNADPQNAAAKKENYELMQAMAAAFEQENGSIICRELLGIAESVKETATPQTRTEGYYKKRPCVELVKCAARIAEQYCMK